MKMLKEFLRKTKYISYPVIFLLTLYLIFWIPIYIMTYDLRTKDDYSRDLKVTFIYKGEEYTINSKVSCINKGVSINAGSFKWFTLWGMKHENNIITLKDGVEAKLWFNGAYGELHKTIFEIEDNRALNICNLALYEDEYIKKISSRFMKFDGTKEQWIYFANNPEKISELEKIDKGYYHNVSNNLLSIRGVEDNKSLNLKVTYIEFGKKQIIKKHYL